MTPASTPWSELQGRNAGEDILVLGLGPSLEDAVGARCGWYTTVGVNDIMGIHRVDYLVLADVLDNFEPSRRAVVASSRPDVLVHAVPLDPVDWPGVELVRVRSEGAVARPNLVRVGGGMFPDGWTSVYMAVLVAWWLGARRIGIAGMDITPDHNLSAYLGWIDRAFQGLQEELQAVGCELRNLSPASWITSVTRGSLADLEPSHTKNP